MGLVRSGKGRRVVGMVMAAVLGAAVVSGAAWALSGAQLIWTGPSAQEEETSGAAGFWIGSSYTTMNRSTNDLRIGYTMRSDFWFRVDADGHITGQAHAVYQPTFDAAPLNAKIIVAKSMASGVVGLLPGGELALAKAAIESGKIGANAGIAGLVGVKGVYDDPQPTRSGAITGTFDEGTGRVQLEWAEEQEDSIPVTVSLVHVKETVELTKDEVGIWTPWQEAATASEGSGGRFVVSDTAKPLSEGDLKGETTQHWTAHRVGDGDQEPQEVTGG